jgi:hypothetical protein
VFIVDGVTHIYSKMDYPSIVEFVRVLIVEGVTHIY